MKPQRLLVVKVMGYSATIYCPDQHVIYDARTPERKGIGGGITARLRLAQAMARQGSEVTVVANVPSSHTYKGVSYEPLSRVRRLKSDVLILNSTGGAVDLSSVLDLEVGCKLTEVWVGGVARVKGLNEIRYDYVVTPSNFIRNVALNEWQVSAKRVFVAYNGVQRYHSFFPFRREQRRDPFRLVYTSHPSKGLESAKAVLRLLRAEDRRFQLYVYGGNKLWGGEDQALEPEPGVLYKGMIGQRLLAEELTRSSFAMHLQAMPEAFGISMVEAMSAGNVVIASPVDAYAEIIRHGYDGFLVAGNHEASETRSRAAALIIELVRRSDFADYVRRNAMSAPLDWDTAARTWQGHWKWIFEQSNLDAESDAKDCGGCIACDGNQLPLADGYHCVSCGLYSRQPQHS